MAKKAPQWGVYRTMSWGSVKLLGRVRAHTEDAAKNAANASRRFDGWDEVRRLGDPTAGDRP